MRTNVIIDDRLINEGLELYEVKKERNYHKKYNRLKICKYLILGQALG